MKKVITKSIPQFSVFLVTLFFSHYLLLLFYDSSKGLDFGKYRRNLLFFSGQDINILDANGSIYFYLISKLNNNKLTSFNGESGTMLNSVIQTSNFYFYVIGVLGLIVLFTYKKYKSEDIFIALSILNFFPTAIYLRLTMKPEILAFTLLPWTIYFLEKYLKSIKKIDLFFASFLLSILITLKASIMGMVMLSIFILFFKEIDNFRKLIKPIFLMSAFSLLNIYFNWKITGGWLFAKPTEADLTLNSKWNFTADFNFFTNIDFKNLLENPYKHIHSDSFISITLLDTLSDYFHFFWNHKEDSNYLAFDKIKFTNNFLIQEYSSQYISIVFTLLFYFITVIFCIKKVKNYKFLLLPFCGLFVLFLNSQGFPSKNFDPTTGDLFKVHYYSFLISISFFVFLLIIYKSSNIWKTISLLLIPIFLFVIGFPKNLSSETLLHLQTKCLESQFCKLINIELFKLY